MCARNLVPITLFWSLNNSDLHLSRDMRFSTTWDLRPEEPQIIMRIFFSFFPRSETHMLLTWVKTTKILIWCAIFFSPSHQLWIFFLLTTKYLILYWINMKNTSRKSWIRWDATCQRLLNITMTSRIDPIITSFN